MRYADKHYSLQRAQDLLRTVDDDDAIIYAALELRLCIEAIVYEKLKVYAKYVPGIVFEKWQPTHALSTLLQFEPDSEEDYEIAIAPESAPGVQSGPFQKLGAHKAIKLKWLKKNYNKVGHYLHVQHGNTMALGFKEIKKGLMRIASELEDIVQNTTITAMAFAERCQFKCNICGNISLANWTVAMKTRQAMCINPQCGAVHALVEEDGKWRIELAEKGFECLKCGATNYLQPKKLQVGLMFTCYNCNREHLIVGRPWQHEIRKSESVE